nr:MAG TPA: hypothetical protein [Caudoviricetes sp.]
MCYFKLYIHEFQFSHIFQNRKSGDIDMQFKTLYRLVSELWLKVFTN